MASRAHINTRTLARAIAIAALAPASIGAFAPTVQARPPTLTTGVAGGSPTFASISPVLAPDRLGARASLAFTIGFSGGQLGVPSPVRNSVIHFPAGMSLDIPSLRACGKAHLLAHGVKGCPPQSKLGSGRALAEVRAGSLLITEEAELWVVLGPLAGGNPTLEILAQGYTPIDERIVLTGTVLPDHPPYGEELEMPIPPLATLEYEPDASIASFSLRIGASSHERGAGASSVLVPSTCTPGGFPFAAEFTYADGSTSSASANVPCP
jgi:hypothetical protein